MFRPRLARFVKETRIPAPPEEVFDWHRRPEAFRDLCPPWERLLSVETAGPGRLEVGTVVTIRVLSPPIPFPLRWVAEHVEFDPPRLFADVQRSGPFARWRHRHEFIPLDDGRATLMRDDIEYVPPGGALGAAAAGPFLRRKLERMFAHRHKVVLDHFSPGGNRGE